MRSIWDPYKNGWIDRDAVWDDEWAWPREQCYAGWRLPKGNGNFWGKYVPDEPNTLIIANLTGPCSGIRQARDRRLTAAVGRVYYWPRSVGWDCTPRAKSDIYDCLVRFVCFVLRWCHTMSPFEIQHMTNYPRMFRMFSGVVCLYVCTFVFPHDISKYDAARITKLDIDKVHSVMETLLFWGQR